MSTQRGFTIVTVVAAILILIGIGAFVAYDMNTPVQEVKVYELPDSIAPSVESDLGTTGTTGAIATGQQGSFADDTNLDHNPVSPEVIAESRRHSEWFDAFDQHHKKRVALKEEQDKLEEDFNSLVFSSDYDQFLRDIADPSYFDKLDAVWAKMEALQNKADILEKEYPVFPSN